MKIFTDEYLPFVLNKFESMLKANRGGDGYFVGDSVSISGLDSGV